MNWQDFFYSHESLLLLMTGVSCITFAISAVCVPMVVIRIPVDYFNRDEYSRSHEQIQHPVLRGGMLCIKNLAGYFLIVAGLLMLVLPGQGLLTLFIGIMFIDFPGKFRFEKWLVSRRPILLSINWLRNRANCQPLSFHFEQRK